jgi:hypothetical protein
MAPPELGLTIPRFPVTLSTYSVDIEDINIGAPYRQEVRDVGSTIVEDVWNAFRAQRVNAAAENARQGPGWDRVLVRTEGMGEEVIYGAEREVRS